MKKKTLAVLLTASVIAGTMGGTATIVHADEEGSVINIYSWNDEFRQRLEAVQWFSCQDKNLSWQKNIVWNSLNSKRKVRMNEDVKITAFKELVELIKENPKYLPEDFDPDAELEKGRKIFRNNF